MTSWEPPNEVRVASSRQRWRDVAFVHVGYDPERLSERLPDGLEPDTFDDLAWVGITPFRMEASLLPLVSGPRRHVGETNVRTYVRDGRGRDGIWFLSLDLSSGLVARVLRSVAGLPYRAADVRMDADGSRRRYHVDREAPDGRGRMDLEIEVGERIPEEEVDPFEVHVTGRWRAYARRFGGLYTVPVHHPAWTLHRATLIDLRQELRPSDRLPPPLTEPHVMFCPDVGEVSVGMPRPA